MCGINVIVGEDPGNNLIQQMMRSTAHRGPDFSDFTQVSESLYFAGNRLKILDLSDASNQPMWDRERKCVLVWNGAIYNYQDLRNELLTLGFVFSSNSDSEVLLYWLKYYGENGIPKLKGMFAIAFADLSKNKLILARDPSGEKPLYYAEENGKKYFSSESKAIRIALLPKNRIDTKQFVPYFYQRHSYPSETFFENIKQFPPGNAWVFDLKGSEVAGLKWKFPKSNQEKKTRENFEDLLKDAVIHNFHAERPVGQLLSGGADSSLIYALWYEETGEPLPTYTATFDIGKMGKYSDPDFVKKFGKKYFSLNREIKIDLKTLQDNWNSYILSLDQPIGDSAGFLTWMIAKEASKEVKVLITGAGADELFGGYNRHLAFQKYLRHPFFWKGLKKLLPFKIFNSNLKKMLESIQDDSDLTFLQMAALENIPEEFLDSFLNLYPKSEFHLKNALEWDRSFYLVNDVLKIHDGACMAHGIEGRSPYLDCNLISLSQSLTEEEIHEQIGKKWIKEALEKRGLGFISKRKKLGFGLPLAEWTKEKSFLDWIIEPIRKMENEWGQHFPEKMRNLGFDPSKAEGRQFLQIWNLFLLASWLEANK
ncbi:asparagine synthase (glutamine-hydrolyzing) [Shivajiella indica]|uniref:asparagine synthase (glutamine-hydrolyzing) n=1 Tax=Shivajiella indica TaxID=872115 RepID=A0ABW5BC38_9BACT